MVKALLLIVGAAVALPSATSAQSSPQAPAAAAPANRASPVAAAADAGGVVAGDDDRYSTQPAQIEDYQLGTGDKIRITVFNEPTLSGDFAVGADGQLSLPLIGNVPARGKRPGDIAAAVQSALGAGYLRNPQVSAEVTTYRPFFILGEVKMPGQYPYAVGLTVFNAIATAQGYTPRSDRRNVFIRRAGQGQEERFKLTPDMRILPGDTIRIGERYF
ncbi:polysaccharide biosynthesis/export family protein [Sphingomonas sp.]|uniref:polysaccharide biosynthesis/export family protein n=1 Tax=Sphingomonas sp. TaxID=28214 RepID=UPI003B00A14B